MGTARFDLLDAILESYYKDICVMHKIDCIKFTKGNFSIIFYFNKVSLYKIVFQNVLNFLLNWPIHSQDLILENKLRWLCNYFHEGPFNSAWASMAIFSYFDMFYWRIQVRQSQRWMRKAIIWPIPPPKNCIKLKEFGLWGRVPGASIRFVNVYGWVGAHYL